MKTSTIVWSVIIIVFFGFLVGRAVMTEHGFGKEYVREVPREFAYWSQGDDEPRWVAREDLPEDVDFESIPEDRRAGWTNEEKMFLRDYLEYQEALAAGTLAPDARVVRFSWSRTIGLWIGAFFTLAIFSFLYKDNPFYKIAESVVVGVSAAFWMVVGFWDMIIPNLMGKLLPDLTKRFFLPDINVNRDTWGEFLSDMVYLIPLVLGIMLLWRLAPKGAWISRWAIAFIMGTTVGLRLIAYLQGDFLVQIQSAIMPLAVWEDGTFQVWHSMDNILLLLGTMTCLVYFFFSIEHKGVVGATARVGIWVLMITFGAAFGFTVMGRIALLAIRIEFLVDDWLWLIDPQGRRAVLDAAVMMLGHR